MLKMSLVGTISTKLFEKGYLKTLLGVERALGSPSCLAAYSIMSSSGFGVDLSFMLYFFLKGQVLPRKKALNSLKKHDFLSRDVYIVFYTKLKQQSIAWFPIVAKY